MRPTISNHHMGFTLLELLISLTIVGLIVVVIFGAFRIGVRAWEKGEKDIEIHQRQRIILNLIRRQLRSTFVRRLRDGDQQPFFLKGDNKSMEFWSCIPIVPRNQVGMVYAKYLIKPEDGGERERLIFYEKNLFWQDKDMELEDLDEDDFFELISGVHSIGFEYWKGEEGEETPKWQETWDPDIDKGFPKAVKVTLKGDLETAPIRMIVRIKSELG